MMKEAITNCYIHFGYTNINYVLYKRASEQSISFFLSMPKWTHALFATNQFNQDKRGFSVTDANIGSIGPVIAVLGIDRDTYRRAVKLKLELDWFCSKCESEVNLFIVLE